MSRERQFWFRSARSTNCQEIIQDFKESSLHGFPILTVLFASVEKRVTGYTDLQLKLAEGCEYSYNDLNIFQKPVKKHAGPVGLAF